MVDPTDPLLGRQRDRSHRGPEDPTKPVERDNKVYLPSQLFSEWPAILQVARKEINALMLKPEYARELLVNRENFNQVAQALIEKHARDWRIQRSQFMEVSNHLYNEFFGYGALGRYLEDPGVEDILLNSWEWMDVIKNGKKEAIRPTPFTSDRDVKEWLQTVVFTPSGKEFNRSNPSENAVLRDGSRVFAFTDPISPYTGFAIRRHRKEVFRGPKDYMETGIAPLEFFKDIRTWTQTHRTIVIAGATGSGKTTFINFAASLVPHEERLITLEDTPELQISHPRVLSLRTYESGARAAEHGEKDIPMRDLLRYSLRLKPDRIIVGEVRDAETFDMLDALNTGHAGSFTTLHSNSTTDAITRLQTMAIRASVDYPLSALQDLIASVIDIVLHIKNFDGQRRVVQVDQVIYRHHHENFDNINPMKRIYENLGMRALWQWNREANQLVRMNDYLLPDHE